MMMKKLVTGSLLALASAGVFAGPPSDCPVTYDQLKSALTTAIGANNGGLSFDMWGTVVNKDGRICAVASTGEKLNDQWLASRVISAQKAYTAASLANNKGSFGTAANTSFAFTTAGLYLATQPGGSLWGLQFSNPVDPSSAYAGNQSKFGSKNDPMVGKRVGGNNVFGGGLALFDANDQLVGGLGVSGNTSCADHNIAWRTRNTFVSLKLAQGPGSEVNIDYVAGYPDCGQGEAGIWALIKNSLPQRFQ
ncbi:heme-binding protein [Methylomicrobium sp. Wu6]|uniref:heme-binding protein n=1 Tax=Methylomicrobium sp. Wu6 TaxID=3107928 RepID=UPI002DD63A57|nr:heme-binding protein [Methylomicrobium sp. Wu6]MEC4750644.1 heme-binding protein [Methylomicrobium sp. Wu6]